MMNATLRGKPDAGNPHVRFDEGEVASAKPRRGSLLYKKTIFSFCAIFSFVHFALAEYTDDCITFSCAESFGLKESYVNKTWNGTLWISTNKVDWAEWGGARVRAAKAGDTYHIYVRGDANNTIISDGHPWIISSRGNPVSCSGNIETLRGATGDNPSPTTMANKCYANMFDDCDSLIRAPSLTATTLSQQCYYSMFWGCKALKRPPALQATTLAFRCYDSMFRDCTSLAYPPALPAMTLAEKCYWGMFYGCEALKAVPELPATTLVRECYYKMFVGCSALEVNTSAPGKEWKLPVTSTTALYWGDDMFADTAGKFKGQPELNTTYYIANVPEPMNDCITFSSAKAFTLKTDNNTKDWNGTLWTSTDKFEWTEWKGTSVAAEQMGGIGPYYLHVRGDANNTAITGHAVSYLRRWVLAGSNIACTGNIETLRGATGNTPSPTTMADECYAQMFNGCTALTSAPALPATTLANECYASMFSGCTALTNAPALPATTLTSICYREMFSDCTALTTAPVLSATTLKESSCIGMFSGCTALTNAPALPATVMTESCYARMFKGCSALKEAPSLPATTLARDCYCLMFYGCSALKEAPSLPATTLADECYFMMFYGCTSLTTASALPATTSKYRCYREMFCGCAALTNAPALPATTLAVECYDGMFTYCAALKDAPALPAMTLTEKCYRSMFKGCAALKDAPALPATKLAKSCCECMFEGCTSLTDVPKLPAVTLVDRCYYSMFQGCSALKVDARSPGREWELRAVDDTATDWGTDMFKNTIEGEFAVKGQPILCKMYYIPTAYVPGSDWMPWAIGAGAGDRVKAWTNGTGKLLVRGDGKMRSFVSDGSDVPWPAEDISEVSISADVTAIGQNAWLGFSDSVTYNGFSAGAAKTMSSGFGGTTQYARTAFRGFLVDGASIHATVALETAPSLTNEWAEVELKAGDVSVENGRIVIQHETASQSQGFYLIQPTE